MAIKTGREDSLEIAIELVSIWLTSSSLDKVHTSPLQSGLMTPSHKIQIVLFYCYNIAGLQIRKKT